MHGGAIFAPISRASHMTTAKASASSQHVVASCEMASKAYVASMTVTELKQELKQRGLSTRGSKKSLRDRLERVNRKHVNYLYERMFRIIFLPPFLTYIFRCVYTSLALGLQRAHVGGRLASNSK